MTSGFAIRRVCASQPTPDPEPYARNTGYDIEWKGDTIILGYPVAG
jgi:hypothetical protein